jgi:hypothetical protein
VAGYLFFLARLSLIRGKTKPANAESDRDQWTTAHSERIGL